MKPNDPIVLNSFQALKAVKDELEKAAKQAQEKKQQRFEDAKKVLAALRKAYPVLFNTEAPQPLAVGLEKDIRKLHPEFTAANLRFALAIWTKREKYLQAVMAGEHRYGLDGVIAGAIGPQEKDYSKNTLDQRKDKKRS